MVEKLTNYTSFPEYFYFKFIPDPELSGYGMIFPDPDPAKSSGSTFTTLFLSACTRTSGLIYYYDKALSVDTETGPGSDSKSGNNEDPCFPLLSRYH